MSDAAPPTQQAKENTTVLSVVHRADVLLLSLGWRRSHSGPEPPRSVVVVVHLAYVVWATLAERLEARTAVIVTLAPALPGRWRFTTDPVTTAGQTSRAPTDVPLQPRPRRAGRKSPRHRSASVRWIRTPVRPLAPAVVWTASNKTPWKPMATMVASPVRPRYNPVCRRLLSTLSICRHVPRPLAGWAAGRRTRGDG